MIFLDESGKRWKRIKRSTAGITLAVTLPVLALIGGSLAYHPQWGVLPLISQATGAVLSGSTKTLTGNPGSTAPKRTSTSITATAHAIAQVAYQLAAKSSITAPPIASAPSSTPTPTPAAPAKPQSVSPTGGDPTQNDPGLAHRPK